METGTLYIEETFNGFSVFRKLENFSQEVYHSFYRKYAERYISSRS